MNININGNELQNQTIFDAMQIGNPESTKGQTVNGKTILGANLKLNQEDDSIEGKRQEAREKAMKLVKGAWDGDSAIDNSVQERNDHYKQMQQEANDANQQVASLQEQKDALLEEYNGDTSNPEYIERSIGLSKQMNKFSADAQHAQDAMRDDVGDVHAINIERLKTHGMVDAADAAEGIMDAANQEIIGMAMEDAKEFIDEKLEENEEAAKKTEEEKEEQEKHLEELQENKELQEALIAGNQEAVEEARQQQQKHDASDDVDMDQILDAAMTMDLNQSVQQGLDDIKNSMNLLEADLKGIKVDEEV